MGASCVLTASLLVGDVSGKAASETSTPLTQEAFSVEAQLYARDFSVSVETAQARISNQQVLGDFAAALEDAYPSQIAGIWLEHEPAYRLRVSLVRGTKEVLDAAKAIPTSIGVTPIVVDADAALSLTELEAELGRMRPSIDMIPGASSELDVPGGQIVVLIESAQFDQHSQDALADLRAVSAAPLRMETYDAPASDGNIHGGRNLTSCTGGFTVIHNPSGFKGFLTAGHCTPNDQTIYATTGNYATDMLGEVRDAYRDAQWNVAPTGGNVYPRFYAYYPDGVRDLLGSRGRDQQLLHAYTCHRGKSTDISCGTLRSKTYAPTYANACPSSCASTWMRVEGSAIQCYFGDSGGPAFYENVALGIYKGQPSDGTGTGDCDWWIYMAINYAAELDVSTLKA